MRLPWPGVVGGFAVAAVGATGLIRGAMPQSPAGAGSSASAAGPIVVTGAYVRAPVPPTKIAAGYFTVYNTTGTDDRLESVETGAGASAELHATESNGDMEAMATGVVVPAHGTLVLSTGANHVMIEQLYGPLKPGETVNMELDFQNAGPVNVTAPVIAVGTPPPAGSGPSSSPTPSGAPS